MKKYFLTVLFAMVLLVSCTKPENESNDYSIEKESPDATTEIKKGTPPPTNGIKKGTPPPTNG